MGIIPRDHFMPTCFTAKLTMTPLPVVVPAGSRKEANDTYAINKARVESVANQGKSHTATIQSVSAKKEERNLNIEPTITLITMTPTKNNSGATLDALFDQHRVSPTEDVVSTAVLRRELIRLEQDHRISVNKKGVVTFEMLPRNLDGRQNQEFRAPSAAAAVLNVLRKFYPSGMGVDEDHAGLRRDGFKRAWQTHSKLMAAFFDIGFRTATQTTEMEIPRLTEDGSPAPGLPPGLLGSVKTVHSRCGRWLMLYNPSRAKKLWFHIYGCTTHTEQEHVGDGTNDTYHPRCQLKSSIGDVKVPLGTDENDRERVKVIWTQGLESVLVYTRDLDDSSSGRSRRVLEMFSVVGPDGTFKGGAVDLQRLAPEQLPIMVPMDPTSVQWPLTATQHEPTQFTFGEAAGLHLKIQSEDSGTAKGLTTLDIVSCTTAVRPNGGALWRHSLSFKHKDTETDCVNVEAGAAPFEPAIVAVEGRSMLAADNSRVQGRPYAAVDELHTGSTTERIVVGSISSDERYLLIDRKLRKAKAVGGDSTLTSGKDAWFVVDLDRIFTKEHQHVDEFPVVLDSSRFFTPEVDADEMVPNRPVTLTAADVGSRVTVEGYDGQGTLRFFGEHVEKKVLRCGVEFGTAIGKNNGTVGGHKYFECADACGVLVAPETLSKAINHLQPVVAMRFAISMPQAVGAGQDNRSQASRNWRTGTPQLIQSGQLTQSRGPSTVLVQLQPERGDRGSTKLTISSRNGLVQLPGSHQFEYVYGLEPYVGMEQQLYARIGGHFSANHGGILAALAEVSDKGNIFGDSVLQLHPVCDASALDRANSDKTWQRSDRIQMNNALVHLAPWPSTPTVEPMRSSNSPRCDGVLTLGHDDGTRLKLQRWRPLGGTTEMMSRAADHAYLMNPKFSCNV